MLEVVISDVSITNVGFAIFLKPNESKTSKVVPIFIGPLETYSISSALDGVTPPRPNTHDLLVNMLSEMGMNIMHIVINDIIGHIFYARIIIQSHDGIIEVDSRPSDSIAIAIRVKCPIYMNEKVYNEAAVVIGEESSQGGTGVDSEKEDKEEEIPAPRSELERCKQNLQQAVDAENFEEAAVLRDKIQELQQEN